MRFGAFVQRLVVTGVLVGAIAGGAASLVSANVEADQGVPVKEAAPIAAPAPPATVKPAPAPPPAATTGAIFRDEFTKPALDPAWKVELEDKDRWAIDGGELVIITPAASQANRGGRRPGRQESLVLNRDLQGDFTVTARLNVAIVRDGNTWRLASAHPGRQLRRRSDSPVLPALRAITGACSWASGSADKDAQLLSGGAWDAGEAYEDKPGRAGQDRGEHLVAPREAALHIYRLLQLRRHPLRDHRPTVDGAQRRRPARAGRLRPNSRRRNRGTFRPRRSGAIASPGPGARREHAQHPLWVDDAAGISARLPSSTSIRPSSPPSSCPRR